MRTIKYKHIYGVGENAAPWENESLEKFVFLVPHLAMALRLYKLMPPYAVLNDLFSMSRDDAGMSGGVEWNQFSIEQSEYDELVEELCTDPKLNIQLDSEASSCKDFAQWQKEALRKCKPIKNS